jgi:peptide methionine sulfoxide reductase MsrB
VRILTKEEVEERKEILKATITVPDVLSRYGIEVKRGRCTPICHEPRIHNAKNAKVSDGLYYCFPCDKTMDIFDITMHFNNCDFWTAFELLGGTEKPSFTSVVKANKAKRERDQRIAKERKEKDSLKQIQMYITAYRNIIAEEEPFSELWCYCINKLQYQLYLHEYYTEKR